MIYSPNINKICGLCQMAHKIENDNVYCDIKKVNIPLNTEGCDKFKYDILKRHVRRMKRLKTDFNPEDFSL